MGSWTENKMALVKTVSAFISIYQIKLKYYLLNSLSMSSLDSFESSWREVGGSKGRPGGPSLDTNALKNYGQWMSLAC